MFCAAPETRTHTKTLSTPVAPSPSATMLALLHPRPEVYLADGASEGCWRDRCVVVAVAVVTVLLAAAAWFSSAHSLINDPIDAGAGTLMTAVCTCLGVYAGEWLTSCCRGATRKGRQCASPRARAPRSCTPLSEAHKDQDVRPTCSSRAQQSARELRRCFVQRA